MRKVPVIERLKGRITVIKAPSSLGLKQTGGVEELPDALESAGLLKQLGVKVTESVPTLPYNPNRDERTQVLNPHGIRAFSLALADQVTAALKQNRFPVVLGGDCSILIGCMLALRNLGARYGLFSIDGHADFYTPETSPTGEVADMDLAIVSGRGPDTLTNIEHLKPYVLDRDVVLFGYRDTQEAREVGSPDVSRTDMRTLDLKHIRSRGIASTASDAMRELVESCISGVWIHLDVDVLHNNIMPAVDYPMPGGIRFAELTELLRTILVSSFAVGMDITTFNPALDPDGNIAQSLTTSLVEGFREKH